MSRIGKLPVALPQGVKGFVAGNIVTVEGPRGKLNFTIRNGVKIDVIDEKLVFSIIGTDGIGTDGIGTDRQAKADYGTARATLNNMVHGVSKGWTRVLELVGVGFVAKLQGNSIVLAVGFSHEVTMEIPNGIKAVVTKTKIELESTDRELLGTFAAKIRQVQPPEPYLGKGIKYSDEKVRRKAGKTGKK